MSDPLTDAANAISGSSPNVKRFAQLAADRILRLEAQVNPPAPPTPGPVFVQGYTATEIQALRTAGNIVAPKAYSVTFPSATNAEFEVRSGDQYSTWSGERAQIQLPQTAYQGKEGQAYHWHFTFTLDPAFQFSDGFYTVLWEHHHTGSTGSPPSSLQLHGANVVWRQVKSPDPAQSIYWTETPLAVATPGRPMAVDVSCVLSTDPAKAQTVVFVNGRQTAISGPNLLTSMNVYPMWGLYRAPSPLTQVVTFSPVERFA